MSNRTADDSDHFRNHNWELKNSVYYTKLFRTHYKDQLQTKVLALDRIAFTVIIIIIKTENLTLVL